MSESAIIAKAFGVTQTDPEWQTHDRDRIPAAGFGKDHWSTFAYLYHRIIDHKGLLNWDHMRIDGTVHPVQSGFGARKQVSNMSRTTKYPTIAKDPETGERVDITDHDDMSCIDDLIAAGLVTVTMPKAKGQAFVIPDNAPSARRRGTAGKVVTGADPHLLTGLGEARLTEFATFAFTPLGWDVHSLLSQHKAAGEPFGTFAVDLDTVGSRV